MSKNDTLIPHEEQPGDDDDDNDTNTTQLFQLGSSSTPSPSGET